MKIDMDSMIFGTAVAIGAISVPAVMRAWLSGTKLKYPKPPQCNDAKWKLVGSLTNITIYPLKSGKGLELQEAECTQLGLTQIKNNENEIQLKDRYFIIFREDNGDKVTGVTIPKILQISLIPNGKDSVRIKYPGEPDLIVEIPKQGEKVARMLRGEPVKCLDCGDEAATWLTRILRGEDENEKNRLRLGYWPPTNASRNLVGTYSELFNDHVFKGVSNADGGAFSDFTSYMLMISSSVDELNKRLVGFQISPRQFRPNFYIQTDEPPFSDLRWKWVRIGDVIFKYVKGCKRCAFTTYDPDDSKKLPRNEPLRTLCNIEEAKTNEPIEESPMMGIHLGSSGSGSLKLGDLVYAIE